MAATLVALGVAFTRKKCIFSGLGIVNETDSAVSATSKLLNSCHGSFRATRPSRATRTESGGIRAERRRFVFWTEIAVMEDVPDVVENAVGAQRTKTTADNNARIVSSFILCATSHFLGQIGQG